MKTWHGLLLLVFALFVTEQVLTVVYWRNMLGGDKMEFCGWGILYNRRKDEIVIITFDSSWFFQERAQARRLKRDRIISVVPDSSRILPALEANSEGRYQILASPSAVPRIQACLAGVYYSGPCFFYSNLYNI